MARVILDIPSEKISPFLRLVSALGIEKNAIGSSLNQSTIQSETMKPKQLNQLFPFAKIVLFDWEFFSNELEFE